MLITNEFLVSGKWFKRKMVENGNYTELNYGDTPYPDDGTPWLDSPTSNQVLGIEETEETSTVPSDMIPTGTGGEYLMRTYISLIFLNSYFNNLSGTLHYIKNYWEFLILTSQNANIPTRSNRKSPSKLMIRVFLLLEEVGISRHAEKTHISL